MEIDQEREDPARQVPTLLRQAITFALLLLITASFWLVNLANPDIYTERLFLTFLAISIVYLLFTIIMNAGLRGISSGRARYSFRRMISIVQLLVLVVIAIRIWIDTNYIFVAYGIIAAGVAIALQDLFKNFVGGIIIMTSRIYQVGDRIELLETAGDVIDIGMMNTTLLEIHACGVKGDQPTGRITQIPNGTVITENVFNYTLDHGFIWDEITLPITYGSNWRKAAELFADIAKDETRSVIKIAEQDIERIGRRYYLEKRVVEPAVFLSLTDNWINITVRYVTEVRSRRILHDRLSRLLLEAVERNDWITIATESVIVHRAGAVEERKPGRRTG